MSRLYAPLCGFGRAEIMRLLIHEHDHDTTVSATSGHDRTDGLHRPGRDRFANRQSHCRTGLAPPQLGRAAQGPDRLLRDRYQSERSGSIVDGAVTDVAAIDR